MTRSRVAGPYRSSITLAYSCLGPYPVVLKDYSWFYTEESLQKVYRKLYGMPEIKLRSTVCKASDLVAILSLQFPTIFRMNLYTVFHGG